MNKYRQQNRDDDKICDLPLIPNSFHEFSCGKQQQDKELYDIGSLDDVGVIDEIAVDEPQITRDRTKHCEINE